MQVRQVFLALLLVGTTMLGHGCKTTIVGPEGQTRAVYKWGRLSAEEQNDINAVYQATEMALTALELTITQKTKDELTAYIVARDAQDRKITISLLAVTKGSTKISIVAGSFVKARRIYQKIHDSLQNLK